MRVPLSLIFIGAVFIQPFECAIWQRPDTFRFFPMNLWQDFRVTKRFDDPSFIEELEKLRGQLELQHLDYGTPEWNMGMYEYLLKLKNQGQDIGNLFVAEEMNGQKRVICKPEPYNQCFSIGDNGSLTTLGRKQRPVRLLRVY